MKRFLIWGIKWTCLSLCGFALCGNMAYVAVSANSLAYDEDSSSDESYTNSNDYTENSFAESDTSVKNFAESNDNDDESYSEPNDYEQPDEIQEAQDNEPETGLKAIQGFGKKSEENIAEKISNPYGVYYTTPKCEDMDDYWGEKHHDSIIFVISKSLDNKENYAIIDITVAINDSLDDTIQVKYNSEKERWEGKGNILLEYDSALGKYVFTNDKIRVCLEEITSESAALYDSSHQQYSYQDPMLEGAFVSEVGMNNGLTVYIYNLYNTKYYCVMLETKDGTTTVIGEKQTLGEYIYNDFTINIDGTEYYIDGVDLDENRIATAIRVYSLLGEDENEYYLKRSEDYFDGALNQDIYSGTYSIKDLNATINLKYDKESELFSYDISVNGTSIDTSSSTAICTGNLGYRIVSADFIMDYSDYILNGSDIQIKIPSISSETYSCVLESSGNTVNYRAAFQYILEDAYKHYGESCKYTLFDLDNDGVKELILSEGTCNADWINDVYCVNDYGLGLGIGSFARPVVLYEAPDGNGIYAVWGNQGLEEVTRITKNGSELEEELILSDSINYDENYITYPNEIMTAYANDYSLLEG